MIPIDEALKETVKSLPFARFRDSKHGDFRWYYAEDGVYVVRRIDGNEDGPYVIVKASGPEEAVGKVVDWSAPKPPKPDPYSVLGDALKDTVVDCGECGIKCPSSSRNGVAMYDCQKFAAMRDAVDENAVDVGKQT